MARLLLQFGHHPQGHGDARLISDFLPEFQRLLVVVQRFRRLVQVLRKQSRLPEEANPSLPDCPTTWRGSSPCSADPKAAAGCRSGSARGRWRARPLCSSDRQPGRWQDVSWLCRNCLQLRRGWQGCIAHRYRRIQLIQVFIRGDRLGVIVHNARITRLNAVSVLNRKVLA